ncbi:MAG: HigA family addiction module antitoxin [Rhizonema sp. PD38]|nr:HigA family addiction module antitoxin [Rhizonema sp. PD38]
MSNTIQNQYKPDYVSPPGETLEEVLEERGMSQAELAERTGRPKKTINEIINAKAAITPETALQLERVLGIPASFWNNRERRYQEAKVRAEEKERFLVSGQQHSKAGILQFAIQIGIAPGIVVERLQHDGVLPSSHCNEQKQRFE